MWHKYRLVSGDQMTVLWIYRDIYIYIYMYIQYIHIFPDENIHS